MIEVLHQAGRFPLFSSEGCRALEAAALALGQLEPGLDTGALWEALDAFVALQQSLASAARARAT